MPKSPEEIFSIVSRLRLFPNVPVHVYFTRDTDKMVVFQMIRRGERMAVDINWEGGAVSEEEIAEVEAVISDMMTAAGVKHNIQSFQCVAAESHQKMEEFFRTGTIK